MTALHKHLMTFKHETVTNTIAKSYLEADLTYGNVRANWNSGKQEKLKWI